MAGREICDVCAREVPAEEAVRVEWSLDDLTCPTPMTLHRSCHEQASALWAEDPTSTCIIDPEFPEETTRWTPGVRA